MSDWYTEIENDTSLEQGDIIEKCKIIIPSESDYNILLQPEIKPAMMNYLETDCIILSQSCDLENEKIKFVILCPIATLEKACDVFPYFKSSDGREQLRQGNQPQYHLLNKLKLHSKEQEDFYCVSFHHIFSVPKEYLKAIVKDKKRYRMLSPYKENLAQSFARYFMRVGLPLNIPKEEIKNYLKTK